MTASSRSAWIRQRAAGNGYQIDAIASYQFTNAFGLGIDGRWWHLDTNAVDSFQQPEPYRTDREFFRDGYHDSYALNSERTTA